MDTENTYTTVPAKNTTPEINYRILALRSEHSYYKENRLMLAFVIEKPVCRDFDYEVIDQGGMDLSFM